MSLELKDYGIAGLCLYIMSGIIRSLVAKLKGRTAAGPHEPRITALEINLSRRETQIIDLERRLAEITSAIDDKMDIVLDDVKELTKAITSLVERVAVVETQVRLILDDRLKRRDT